MGERQQHPKPQSDAPPQGAEEKEFLSSEAEDAVDRESEDSFPASDPPSHTPVTQPGQPRPKKPQ